MGFLTSRRKRGFDLIVAGTLLVLLLPLLLVVALLVRVSSPGPIFHRQSRIGYRSEPFTILKFRTMRIDRDGLVDQHRAAELQAAGFLLKTSTDPRITSVGKWLRRSSIDELPQLVNVIQGDMSLVGPRPLLPFMVTGDPALLRQRASAKPGMTGLWQVSARDKNSSLQDMIDFDLAYVRTATLRTDLAILLRTIPAAASGRGAV